MLRSRIFDRRRTSVARGIVLATRAMAPLVLLSLCAAPLRSQTIDDGIMMPKKALCTGFMYGHDSWDQYWEGTLKRGNGNIGTVTTETLSWGGDYGVTDRLNVIAMVPYVWTSASQGTLHGQKGFQDLTVAVKYNLLETDFTKHGFLRAIVVGLGQHAAHELRAGPAPPVHRQRQLAPLGPAHLDVPGQARLFPERLGRLHLARQGHPRPARLLHGRPAVPERRGADARRLRLPR